MGLSAKRNKTPVCIQQIPHPPVTNKDKLPTIITFTLDLFLRLGKCEVMKCKCAGSSSESRAG